MCIQILIDMALKITSLAKLKTPKEYSDLADIFERQGALTVDESKTFKKMIGFRNLLLHVYPKIDPKIVFQVVKDEAERDLRKVASKLAQFAETITQERG
ncbi:MAG: HepT-like ribonuclease domain-containing protein [Candidatus Jordarchaeaceae archaeon]